MIELVTINGLTKDPNSNWIWIDGTPFDYANSGHFGNTLPFPCVYLFQDGWIGDPNQIDYIGKWENFVNGTTQYRASICKRPPDNF
uniref:C-type lectin domain-containing protein n=1 Tax=Acrobeloides nanus TaxID=290746 RepID=A0A914CZZ2_9BILA